MVERKSIEDPDEIKTFDGGRIELVWIGGLTFGRATFEPGFRWSTSLRRDGGSKSCQLCHQGIVTSGRLRVAPEDGEEVELVPGDVFSISPGHDTWVVGDEPVVILDFTGDDHLAKMLEWTG